MFGSLLQEELRPARVLAEDRENAEWLIEEGTYNTMGPVEETSIVTSMNVSVNFCYECVCTDICIFPRFCSHVA